MLTTQELAEIETETNLVCFATKSDVLRLIATIRELWRCRTCDGTGLRDVKGFPARQMNCLKCDGTGRER